MELQLEFKYEHRRRKTGGDISGPPQGSRTEGKEKGEHVNSRNGSEHVCIESWRRGSHVPARRLKSEVWGHGGTWTSQGWKQVSPAGQGRPSCGPGSLSPCARSRTTRVRGPGDICSQPQVQTALAWMSKPWYRCAGPTCEVGEPRATAQRGSSRTRNALTHKALQQLTLPVTSGTIGPALGRNMGSGPVARGLVLCGAGHLPLSQAVPTRSVQSGHHALLLGQCPALTNVFV